MAENDLSFDRYLHQGEQPAYGREVDAYSYLRIGYITRIDYETGKVDVSWIDIDGGRSNLFFSNAFSSKRGTIRGMPEVGSIVRRGIREFQVQEQ